jgi:hypothetical protein
MSVGQMVKDAAGESSSSVVELQPMSKKTVLEQFAQHPASTGPNMSNRSTDKPQDYDDG